MPSPEAPTEPSIRFPVPDPWELGFFLAALTLLALVLSKPAGRKALKDILNPPPLTYWPPRAVIAQFKRQK